MLARCPGTGPADSNEYRRMNNQNYPLAGFLKRFTLLAAIAGLTMISRATWAVGPLTTIAEVRKLSAAEAEQQLPVKLRGTVTFFDEALFSRFIQDDTAGIYLLELTNDMPVVASGQIVEVEGVTGPGEFAPVVQPTSIKVVGEGRLPAPRVATLDELVSGQNDSQFVEFTGLVRSVRFEKDTEYHLLDFAKGGERFSLYTKQISAAQAQNLVEATVTVRGVCATMFNHQRQLFGIRLLSPNTEVVIEKPAPANPFAQTEQPLNSLLQFAPEGRFEGRVKVAGTVSYSEPGRAIFIQNEKTGLYCQTPQRDTFQPGDRVQIVGFPAKGEYTPILEDALVHKSGAGTAPTAAETDVNEILTGIHDCRLVEIPARVVGTVQRGVNRFLLLQSGGFTFQAYLPAKINEAELSAIQEGSEVKATGICMIERGNQWQAGDQWRAASFHLLLRSPQDIVLVQAPAQLAAGDNTGLLVGMAAIAVGLLLWVVLLRRQLRGREKH